MFAFRNYSKLDIWTAMNDSYQLDLREMQSEGTATSVRSRQADLDQIGYEPPYQFGRSNAALDPGKT